MLFIRAIFPSNVRMSVTESKRKQKNPTDLAMVGIGPQILLYLLLIHSICLHVLRGIHFGPIPKSNGPSRIA